MRKLDDEMEDPESYAEKKIDDKIHENYYVMMEKFMRDKGIIKEDQMLMTN